MSMDAAGGDPLIRRYRSILRESPRKLVSEGGLNPHVQHPCTG